VPTYSEYKFKIREGSPDMGYDTNCCDPLGCSSLI